VKYRPVGLAYVMTAVQRAGFDFDLIDMDVEDMSLSSLSQLLRRRKYDVCALGCIVTGFRLVRAGAALLRRHYPGVVIVAGNSVASSMPDLLLRHSEVDIAVLGEAEETMVDLLTTLHGRQSPDQVRGICFRRGEDIHRTARREVITNLNRIGFPDWDRFRDPRYGHGLDKGHHGGSQSPCVYPLSLARGCPYSCTFCYHVFQGERYRRYSDQVIGREIERLHDQYGADHIQLWDDLSFPSVASLERFCAQVERLPFHISWDAVTRADLLRRKDLPLVRRMRDLGCRFLCFSVESANAEILSAIGKPLSIERVREQCDVLWQGGVEPRTSVIFGYPQETPESIHETFELLGRCRLFPTMGFLQPLPGTQIYHWARRHGHIRDEFEFLMQAGDRESFHINLTEMPTDRFLGLVFDGMCSLAGLLGRRFRGPLAVRAILAEQMGVSLSAAFDATSPNRDGADSQLRGD
jgi:anaerobic magnesium-protoporphyrin IX monomethyl ester cyclase